jgi:hypothetical protein
MTSRALFLVLSLLVSVSALAQLPANEVALTAGWTDFSDLGGARAIGASYARFLTPSIATELGAVFAGDQIGQARGNTSFTDVHATARVHALRDRLLSPWAALGIAYVSIDDPERSASKIASIVGAGLDVRITRQLSLGAQVHYSPFEVDPRDRFGLSVNPTTLMVAARWRF